MKNVHFAIPEIYGETLSYYELLRKLVNKTNELIDNYNTVPEQIAEAVANLDASQLFSDVLNQIIDSIATDNTKSTNAVKVYKKHDLLYATFNETVNLYESLIDFSTGTATELIPGTNIREVNISELFIELRKLFDNEVVAREQADNGLQTNIDNEALERTQADQTLQRNIDNEKQGRLTGDQNLQNIINNGTLKVHLLWTNTSPKTWFPAQTINIDVSTYKLVLIYFNRSTNSDDNEKYFFIGNTDDKFMCLIPRNDELRYNRRLIYFSGNNISIGDSLLGANNQEDNNSVIPYKIFGIK